MSDTYIDAFLFLLQLTGDLTWSKTAVDDVMVQCQIQLLSNMSLWTQGVNGVKPGPPQDILNTLCPSGCNGMECREGEIVSGWNCILQEFLRIPSTFIISNPSYVHII